MQIHEARELAAAVRRARHRVRYSPHRYATWLLGRQVGPGRHVRDVKASRQRRWLDNPLVRDVAARAPRGVLTRAALEAAPVPCSEIYEVDATVWGSQRPGQWDPWVQTSRPGANLVVLLNFSPQHNAVYRRCLDPELELAPVNEAHPCARRPEINLAWARVDLDLVRGEALVEEVQTDWLRELDWIWEHSAKRDSPHWQDRLVQAFFSSSAASFENLEHYRGRVLANHRSWWADATLFAALWLVVEQLGIRRIYYHTVEGGLRRKRIPSYWAPPRSLYSRLPRRFGFELTDEPPAVLRPLPTWGRLRRRPPPEPPWFRLDV